MKPIALLSNKTRALQRPPLRTRPADAALLVALGFKKPVPPPKLSAQQKAAHRRRASQEHSSTARPAGGLPAAKSQPAAKNQPMAKNSPLPMSQPSAGNQSPAKNLPEAAGDLEAKPQAKIPPATKQKSEVKAPPVQAEEPPASGSFAESSGDTSGSLPELKKQPVSQNLPASEMTSGQKPPPASNMPEKPQEKDSAGTNTPRLNGVVANGKAPGTNGSNGKNDYHGSNGKPNGAGLDGTGASGSGSRSTPPRSLLFRPSLFSTMPTVRSIPPRAAGPAKPPSGVPRSSGRQRDEQHDPALSNERPAAPEIPQTNPLPSYQNGSKSPETRTPDAKPAAASLAARTPGLDQLLKQNASLPDQAAVLGVCEDGLPVLLDLHDPAPGALVVVGDEREKQLEILRNAVASIAGRNSPRSVQFLVLSCEPAVWQSWVRERGFERHCLAIESAEVEIVRNWIVQLADWTEQRRLGQSSGPSVLLIMDTLSFLPQLSFDIRLNFDWMAKEGPQARIWPLAVISTDLAKALSGRRMLRAFQTRMMGYANTPADYVQLAGLDEQTASDFGQRGTFTVKVGEHWLRFKLPG